MAAAYRGKLYVVGGYGVARERRTAAYVLDGTCRLAARGEIGELYVGGAGLARGYWRHPGTTATT